MLGFLLVWINRSSSSVMQENVLQGIHLFIYLNIFNIRNWKFKCKKLWKNSSKEIQSYKSLWWEFNAEPAVISSGVKVYKLLHGCASPQSWCEELALTAVCKQSPPASEAAIHLCPGVKYDNVSIFHFPDVTINKAMIQKKLCWVCSLCFHHSQLDNFTEDRF